MRPQKVVFLQKDLENSFKELSDKDPLKKSLKKAITNIKENIFCGRYVKKELIPKKIKIGQDGLIVKTNNKSGLLLPQVAVEWKWNPKEFLEQTCVKAGLNKDDWGKKECQIFKFQSQIFSEKAIQQNNQKD